MPEGTLAVSVHTKANMEELKQQMIALAGTIHKQGRTQTNGETNGDRLLAERATSDLASDLFDNGDVANEQSLPWQQLPAAPQRCLYLSCLTDTCFEEDAHEILL